MGTSIVKESFKFTNNDVERTVSKIRVPKHPKARLMYYISCIREAIDIEDIQDIDHLTDYVNYSDMSVNDTRDLLVLCHEFQPMHLVGTAIFQDEKFADKPCNAFYETEEANNYIRIGRKSRTIKCVMYYNSKWMDVNFEEPIEYFRMKKHSSK